MKGINHRNNPYRDEPFEDDIRRYDYERKELNYRNNRGYNLGKNFDTQNLAASIASAIASVIY